MTTFPGAIDPALDVTLEDAPSPEMFNELDARTRALEAKVGADVSTDSASVDARIAHIFFLDVTTLDDVGTPVKTFTMADGTTLAIRVTAVAVRDGGNEAMTLDYDATYRCKSGVAYLCGSDRITRDQRTLLAGASVTTVTDGANTVKLKITSGVADRVHWSLRGERIVARPGGLG